MFTDMVGFSRQLGVDEACMLRLLDVHNRIIRQMVAEHHDSIIKTIGDAFLVDFPSVVHAVQSVQAIQAQFCVPLGNPLSCPSPLAGEGTCA
jgi:adenylate cyclase